LILHDENELFLDRCAFVCSEIRPKLT